MGQYTHMGQNIYVGSKGLPTLLQLCMPYNLGKNFNYISMIDQMYSHSTFDRRHHDIAGLVLLSHKSGDQSVFEVN